MYDGLGRHIYVHCMYDGLGRHIYVHCLRTKTGSLDSSGDEVLFTYGVSEDRAYDNSLTPDIFWPIFIGIIVSGHYLFVRTKVLVKMHTDSMSRDKLYFVGTSCPVNINFSL